MSYGYMYYSRVFHNFGNQANPLLNVFRLRILAISKHKFKLLIITMNDWNLSPCIGTWRSIWETPYRGYLELQNVTTLYCWEINKGQYREYLALDDIFTTKKRTPWIGVIPWNCLYLVYWTWHTDLGQCWPNCQYRQGTFISCQSFQIFSILFHFP